MSLRYRSDDGQSEAAAGLARIQACAVKTIEYPAQIIRRYARAAVAEAERDLSRHHLTAPGVGAAGRVLESVVGDVDYGPPELLSVS